jgi:hypothetical protein
MSAKPGSAPLPIDLLLREGEGLSVSHCYFCPNFRSIMIKSITSISVLLKRTTTRSFTMRLLSFEVVKGAQLYPADPILHYS